MTTSSEQVARLLALVPYLQQHQGIAVADAAEAFRVSPAQLMKDLQVLWMCGLPGGLPDDLIEIDMDAAETEGTIHLGNADFLARPMRFTLDEATSLVVALRTLAEVATGETARHVAGALAKLEALTTAERGPQVAISLASGAVEVREALVAAIEARQRVQLVYDGLARAVTTQPVVDPARIDLRDGVAYLQAWSLERDDWRTYRLDRIVAVTPTGEALAEHGPAPEPEPGWFGQTTSEVTLELAPAATWVTEYYPTRGAVRTQGDRMVATFPVASPGWLRALLLRLGGQVRVIDPEGAQADAAATARAALEANAALFGGQS